MKRASLCTGLFLVSCCLFGPQMLGAQGPSFESALAKSSQLIEQTKTADETAQRQTGSAVLQLLEPHAAKDPDVAGVAGMLELSLEQQQFQGQKFESILDQLEQAGAQATSTESWSQFETELNDRLNHLLKGLEHGDLDAADAERLLSVAKYATQALDDVKDLDPVNGKSSKLFKMLNLLHGIAAGAKGLEDPSAKELMAAFRGTLAEITKKVHGVDLKNATTTFEIPAAVAAGMIDQTRRGWVGATETLNHFNGALEGDPEALRQMVESSRRMEEILSSRAYARAIWNALTDRIIDRIPFARTLANWFGGYPTNESVAQWVGVWEGGWNDVRIHPGGRIEPIGTGLFARRGGKLDVTFVSGDTLGGTWEFESYGTKGSFEWKLKSAFHFEGYRQEEGSTVKLRWNCFKNFNRE